MRESNRGCQCDCHDSNGMTVAHVVACCDGTDIAGEMRYWWDDETMVDLGGGMIVPLSELMEDD